MAPSYSANLQEFINNYNEFNSLISDYKTQLDDFNEQVNTLLQPASSRDNTVIYPVSTNKYLKTKNGLLIAMNSGAGEDDFSYNKLATIGGVGAESKYFYVNPSTMTASDISFNIVGTYEFKEGNIIQGGLDDLSFSDNELISSISGEYTTNNSGYITSNVGAGNCTMNDLYMCDSYAKMNNKQFYGLNKDDTNNCACYIFDSQPTNQEFNILTSVPATNSGYSSGKNISYLGIMFDNRLCTLKHKNFSANFDSMYVSNDSNVNEIGPNTYNKQNCNKFTGSGPYNISIFNFDVNGNCIAPT